MKKLILACLLPLTICAQTWVAPTPPVVVDGMRIDSINLSIATNMTARGVMFLSRLSGSNVVSRSSAPLTHAAVTSLLAECGTTLPQLGRLLLGTGGLTNQNEFAVRVDVAVSPITGKSKVLITTLSGQRRVIDEPVVNAALTQTGGSVAVFQHVFLDYAKAHAN